MRQFEAIQDGVERVQSIVVGKASAEELAMESLVGGTSTIHIGGEEGAWGGDDGAWEEGEEGAWEGEEGYEIWVPKKKQRAVGGRAVGGRAMVATGASAVRTPFTREELSQVCG
jgi:hypothetical protein